MELQTKTYRLFDIYPDIAREYAQKLHKKKEDIEFTQKFYASDKSETIDAERAVVSYISTATMDRDNEVLLPKGMKSERYEKSGKPVFWGHRYDEPKDVVGQCQWLKVDKDGKGIVAKTAFRNSEFADEVYRLYTEDLTGQGPILRGFSVGFIPLDWTEGKKDEPRRTYTEWELLEFSCVSIPCNPEAQTILSQKGFKLCERLQKDIDEATGKEIDIAPNAEPPAATSEDVPAEAKSTEAEVLVAELPEPEPGEAMIAPPVEKETAPDLASELASLRTDVAAILARLQVTPEPAPVQAVAPLPAPPPIPVEDIVIESSPDNIEFEPSVPDKAYKEMLETYIKGMDFKRRVDEAVEVALAKIRGKVI